MIISFTGKKGSGKDTCATIVGYAIGKCLYKAFADPIRDIVEVMFGWEPEMFDSPKKDEIDPQWGISPRQAMQYVGTEVGQFGFSQTFPQFKEKVGRELWAHRLLRDRDTGKPNHQNLIITDMRFPHEYRVVAEHADSRGEPYFNILVERLTNESRDTHASETSYMDIPVDFAVLNNFSGVDNLREKLDSIVRYLKTVQEGEANG